MASLKFECLKYVDQYTTDLVIGYIKHSVGHQNIDSVPKLVSTACISFYFVKECFSIYGRSTIINEDQTIIRMESRKMTRNTAYGSIEIDDRCHKIYSWSVQILYLVKPYNIYFGIDSSHAPWTKNKDFTDNNLAPYYAYSSSGRIYSDGSISGYWYGSEWQKGDIIEMQFNTKQRTLKYFVNNIDQNIAFKNIKMENNLNNKIRYKYRLAFCLYSVSNLSASAKLVAFKQIRC